MRKLIWPALLLLMCACTTPVSAPPPMAEFQDQLFNKAGGQAPPLPAQIIATDEAMRQMLNQKVKHSLQTDVRRALYDAIRFNDLKLEYDADKTKTSTEAFHSRSGNCLSLVLMTAALAKELGLNVHYQNVIADENWDRAGSLQFSIGHVNLILGQRSSMPAFNFRDLRNPDNYLVIDFLSADQAVLQKTEEISEQRVLAMYYNNRAVELMAQNQLDQAYWFSRAAIAQDPGFIPAQNTLGVIYRQHGDLKLAQTVFERLLQNTPDNTTTLNNLKSTLNASGQFAAAGQIQARLQKLQPYPPFYFLSKAQQAVKAGDLVSARRWLQEELDRAPYNDESHFWMAIVDFKSANYVGARRELGLAREYSTKKTTQQLYSQKLRLLDEHGD